MRSYFCCILVPVLFALCIGMAMPAHAAEEGADKDGPNFVIKTNRPWRSHAGLFEAEKLLLEKNYVDAVMWLDKILQANKFVADAYAYRAHAYLELGKLDMAEKDLRYTLNINARHMGGYNYYGRLHLARGNMDSAKNQLSALRQLCGGDDCLEYKDLEYRIRKIELGPDDDD